MRLNELRLSAGLSKGNQTFSQLIGDWNKYFKQFRPQLLGTIDGVYRLAMMEYARAGVTVKLVVAYDLKNKTFAAAMELGQYRGAAKNAFIVDAVSSNTKYRGTGLPVKMYAYMIQEEGLILVSDDVQTEGGKAIWEQLANIPGIGVFGYNEKTRKVFQVDMEDVMNDDVYDQSVKDEIDALHREQYYDDIDDARDKEINQEVKKLESALYDVEHIRLFGASVK